ncbi:ankyrin repeat-containing domain [Trichoderma arundinaceum]|uniref:Ankyrin repeat-containing domain n=1 Tax=Trichoderma arundinaceum TaxID=490622 RepID=A0A395P0K4_TRIAR|nr:ankyrin repeat-containing domain [Trichoderma arundinaceum]
MRLLKTDKYEIQEFDQDRIPQYAILSHRWGREELTLQDVEGGVTTKEGFKKVQQCCVRAKADGFDYVWIDTCCINKTSSAELSEAINSMYLWYHQSDRCYAYMADVPSKCTIEESEWFTRGWTLQELIAPSEIYFVDDHWNDLGTKKTLQQVISNCTGIPVGILSGDDDLETASIAQRMSWAANRKTQRLEDRAYSLIGIFGINMPMLYGEGERAFIRLQEEIMKISNDHSLFAWESPDTRGGLLATSPEAFKGSKDIIQLNHFNDPADALRPQGLGLAILQCKKGGRDDRPIAIYIRDIFGTMETFERVKSEKFEQLNLRRFRQSQYPIRKMCIQTGQITPMRKSKERGKCGKPGQYDIYDDVKLEELMAFSNPFALSQAIQAGSQDHVWLLLTRDDLEVNLTNDDRALMLSLAINCFHEAVVKILLARGAKFNSDAFYEAMLTAACTKGHEGIVRLLLDNNSKRQYSGQQLLTAAISGGNLAVIKLLLDRGAWVDIGHASIRLLFSRAAGQANGEIFKLLLDHSAEVDPEGAYDMDVLLFDAILSGHEGNVNLLIDRGAKVNQRDADHLTPLFFAIDGGHEGMVKLFLDRSADVNAQDSNNQTPLSSAIQRGHRGIVTLLLEKGARGDLKDDVK